jgi:predicted nucleotidyltransferase
MKVYLDTTVVSIQIFGGVSEQERKRHSDVLALFAKVDGGEIDAIVSFYVLQELYAICVELAMLENLRPSPERFSWKSSTEGLVSFVSSREKNA